MIIKVKVKPGSESESVEEIGRGSYEIRLKERARDGKANRSLINLLAKEFGASYKNINIKNPKNRFKIIEIKEM